MNRIIFICIAILLLLPSLFAQSGRRVQPTPTPVVDKNAPETYSESIQRQAKPPRMISANRTPTGNKPPTEQQADQSATLSAEDIANAIKVETNLITIPVSVFDRNGLYIPNLQQSDFKIYEDGTEQEIAYFGSSDKPFTVVLLLDTSPSTQYRIEEIRTAAKSFVDQLKMHDRVMVIEFDGNVKVRCELTTDRMAIFKGIDKADFGNGTSIYEAVDQTLRKHLRPVEGRKAVVLFTDGVDTTSRKATYDSTLDLAEESDTMIFPIYYNTFSDNRRLNPQWPPSSIGLPPDIFRPAPGSTAAEYALGKRYVEELADYTGGRVFRPESTPGGLTRAFEGIAEELRRQYNIGYIPNNDGVQGQRKQIKIRVGRPKLVVRARDSYIVGATKK